MTLDAALAAARRDIPECIAAGFVDSHTGSLVAINSADRHLRERFDLIAVATHDFFRNSNVARSMAQFAAGDDELGRNHEFQEVVVYSDGLLHMFSRTESQYECVFVVVCRASVNIGTALSRFRLAHATVEHTARARVTVVNP